MSLTALPLSLESLRPKFFEDDLEAYLNICRFGHIGRVFIACLHHPLTKECLVDTRPDDLARAIAFFKSHGIETGVWISAFGHGSSLAYESSANLKGDYPPLFGVDGTSYANGYCPLSDAFRRDYLSVVRRIAQMAPDIILLDDDFRMNVRRYPMGCFCPAHKKMYDTLLGETVPMEDIERLCFTGGKNRYRDSYLAMCRKTLLDFAKDVRQTIDEVNPAIRASACMVFSTWDMEGTDGIEIARAFAGDATKPLLRTFGAPYHNRHEIIEAIENERLQITWLKNAAPDIEVFSEGDTYPRPRYNVPANALELFDLALLCDGRFDGILKYMADYTQKIGYETGYIDRHILHRPLYEKVASLFAGKTPVGVSVFGAMHKLEHWALPDTYQKGISKSLEHQYRAHTASLLSKNSLPTCYGPSEGPVALCGESARYLPLEQLKNGAILDAPAAQILSSRGCDTGLLSMESLTGVTGEYYIKDDASIAAFSGIATKKIVCSEKASVLSEFLPLNTPAAYLYENGDGQRFLVFAADLSRSADDANYFNNYYRQRQIVDAVSYLSGKVLPVVSLKHPGLYIMASKGDTSMSLLLINLCMDDIPEALLTLDRPYQSVRFVHGAGFLEGSHLHLLDIAPYGFAALEVIA